MKRYLAAVITLVMVGFSMQRAPADFNGDQPETPAGMNKPPQGDTVRMTINGRPVLLVEFQTDHWDIPAAYVQNLNRFGAYLKRHPGSRAEIAAYADHTGHGPANAALSQKRADAVYAYLMGHFRITANRMKAQGYGEISDKIHNETLADRQADRRAYGTIISSKS